MNIDSKVDRELIEHIVKEVMKRVAESNVHEVKRKKDRVLCIAMESEDMRYISKNYLHTDCLEDMNEELDIGVYKYIFLGNITNTQLANISMGLTNDRVSSVIVDCILQGKNIFVLSDGIQYRRYKNTSNIQFYNMMQSYEEKLRSFGIDFINKNEVLEIIESSSNETRETKKESSGKASYVIKEKIITEGLIKKVYEGGYQEVYASKNVIVTPLAKDYIKAHGVNILIK